MRHPNWHNTIPHWQDALRSHIAAYNTASALVAARRLVEQLEQIERDEQKQLGLPQRSHSPQIRPSAAKACLDAGAQRLLDEEDKPSQPTMEGVLVAPSLLQRGEKYGGIDI